MTLFPFSAVLTGDLIGSRTHSAAALTAAFDTLEEIVADIHADVGGQVAMSRYRGDGWQVLLDEGKQALRSALRIMAAFAARPDIPQTRLGIGLGPADRPASGQLASASGRAFEAAGDVIDNMDKRRRLDIETGAGTAITTIVALLDHQIGRWTPPQAESLVLALRENRPTQEEIAATFGVSRQAIQLRLAAVGIDVLRETMWFFESQIRDVWKADPHD